ncbi:sulfate transporter family-domain-containing protein [Emericellopsis atlantica]|uniref:Sulfate transporter family-domain-containing protein n=1 Tax=Emericellopsis atlantica TaxID=2614577 RepID=A0A9P7ZE65_9HYPO|nr:sulfate transporter family-domain-containing protein [Emericellopsis atlantica]KAG9250007.1 sulfate transporter family-domain-containing protein [Emericellopsis atlantica]
MVFNAGTLQRTLARALGIELKNPGSTRCDEEVCDEPLLAQHASEPFFESSPTTAEWVKGQVPSLDETLKYARSLLPCLSWVGHYNLQWLASDLIAGVTVGAVVVPQGMAYSMLAKLDPQYGLYSSFVGVMLYWIFGTSKDISIGPVAVLSTLVGNVVDAVHASGLDTPAHTIAAALSIVSGLIVLAIGLLRWGWIVDLISITCLSAFMTGSAVTIAASQLPALLGVKGFSNRDPPYEVIINTLAHLSEAKIDAAMGLSALCALYLVRNGLSKAAVRFPKRRHLIFFINTMRTVSVIILYTFISFVVNRERREDPAFEVLGNVPQGFRKVGSPMINADLVRRFSSYLPATVIVMLVEHIAIGKSFGRVNNYSIDPSQEMVAIGITNIIGPFLGGYPSTGSFSRTAIKSKAGVRTPAAGLFTGTVVLLATYFLTGIFFYIPSAVLAAVIIHAVGDLITPPKTVFHFWSVSPVDCIIFLIGVVVSVFSHIEDGLYATVGCSLAILLYRILKARGQFLGKIKVHSVIGDHVIRDNHRQVAGQYETFEEASTDGPAGRNVYLPIDHGDGSNPSVSLGNPYPGIFIYRFAEGFNYPNANSTLDYLADYIHARTRRTSVETFERPGDRPWNNPGPRKSAKSRQEPSAEDELPTLKAIVLDFSSVNHVDITSVQRLIDVRNQLDMYASPDVVDWHIACINNRWTKRALVAGGFGVPTRPSDGLHHRWKSIFSVAEIGGNSSAAAVAENDANERELRLHPTLSRDEELAPDQPLPQAPGDGADGEEKEPSLGSSSKRKRKGAVMSGLDMPMLHIDLTSAVQSAIANAEARQEQRGLLEADTL